MWPNLFGLPVVDDFLSQLGTGDITTVEVAERVLKVGKIEEPPKTWSRRSCRRKKRPSARRR